MRLISGNVPFLANTFSSLVMEIRTSSRSRAVNTTSSSASGVKSIGDGVENFAWVMVDVPCFVKARSEECFSMDAGAIISTVSTAGAAVR